MHTIVEMSQGKISLRLVADDQRPVNTDLWKREVQAGLAFQCHRGGGFMLMPHKPEDLVA